MSKKDESIFDLIYEERCEIGENLVGVSLEADKKYDEFNNFVKEKVKDKKIAKKILAKFNDFISAIVDENREECKNCYKLGHYDSEKLKKEIQEIVMPKTMKIDNTFLEELYNCRLEKMGRITEEEKKFVEKMQSQRIDISEYLKDYDENLIEKVNIIIEDRVGQFGDEMSFYCKKYYINGFKDCFNLRIACSDEK